MGWESSGVVGFDLGGPLLQGQTRIAKGKSAYNRKSWAGNLLAWSDLTLGPSFKVKWGQSNLKVLITCLLLVLEVWDGKRAYRKSWAGNLLVWSDLNLGPSFKVTWGQPNLKVLITCLLLVPEVWDGKPTYRKSWAGNLLAWSDLTLGPSFEVKRG